MSDADKLSEAERQVQTRLKALSTRIVTLKAEKQRLAHTLTALQQTRSGGVVPIRRNSYRRLTVQALIVHLIEEHEGPSPLKTLHENLARNGYPLNPQTFRSHVRFLVAAGLIVRCGPRGFCVSIAGKKAEDPK